jgi:DNA-binding PadR family transcriptional regulator
MPYRRHDTLTDPEFAALKAALTLEEEKDTEWFHGFLLAKLLQEQKGDESARALAALYGTVYRVLDRMEEAGFVEGGGWSMAGQRPRRLYRLTGKGKRAVLRSEEAKNQGLGMPALGNVYIP